MARTETEKDRVGKKFARKHWKMIMVFIVGCIIAMAGAFFVFLWHVDEAQALGMVPASLGQWSVGHMFDFVLHLLFWELVLIGIPVAIAAVSGYMLWYRNLPAEERAEYERHKIFSSSDKSKGGGGVSFIIHLLVLLKIHMDGNWWTPISSWTFDYLVEVGVWALTWIFLVVGIALLLGGIWWFSSGIKQFGCEKEDNHINLENA